MKISITQRFFWAIMLAAVLAVVSLVLATQWNLKRGFLQFIKQAEQAGIVRLTQSLQEHYTTLGHWQELKGNQEDWRRMVLQSLPHEISRGLELDRQRQEPPHLQGKPLRNVPPPPGEAPPKKGLPPNLEKQLLSRFFLLDAQKSLIAGLREYSDEAKLIPLSYRGQQIGFLGYIATKNITDDRHLLFLKEQKLVFLIVAGIIVLMSALLSLLLARRLVRPLKSLARATHTMTGGDFSGRVAVDGTDELGKLATDFNRLALTLEKNEQARKQWIADISHELRTPIGILRGETEALIDGVRPLNNEALQSLNAESLRLERLVDDLYQLSMSDLGALSYRKTVVDLDALLDNLVDIYRDDFTQHSLKLIYRYSPGLGNHVFADTERLRQLFSNLIDNSLKYTDPGGQLDITVSRDHERIRICFSDTAPAVDESELDKVFDRLYRVESSRNRSTGGSGLGLALCHNIVEAHEGTISAHKSELGGLLITILFPVAEKRQ